MPDQPIPATSRRMGNYVEFAIKTAIATIVVSLGLVVAAGSIGEPLKTGLRKSFKDEKTRIRLIGLLTTNPAVHWRVSLIEERKGNLKASIDEIELALGLLELHSAGAATRQRYVARLETLNRNLRASVPADALK